jgi:hypothetical protein
VLRLPSFFWQSREEEQRLCIGNTFEIWLCLPIIAGRTEQGAHGLQYVSERHSHLGSAKPAVALAAQRSFHSVALQKFYPSSCQCRSFHVKLSMRIHKTCIYQRILTLIPHRRPLKSENIVKLSDRSRFVWFGILPRSSLRSNGSHQIHTF